MDLLKLCFIVIFMTSFTSVHSQDILFEENFENPEHAFTLNTTDENGTANGSNSWVVNNGYQGGSATVSCLGFDFVYDLVNTPEQPVEIVNSPQSNYLHVMSNEAFNSGFSCASYRAADDICVFQESYFSEMTSDISTVGYTDITLDFYWLCIGGSASYGEIYFSTNSGDTWTLLNSYGNQSSWMQSTVQNGAFDDQPALRFGFRFFNGVALDAADPPFSIDDIKISGTPIGGCDDTFSSITVEACDEYDSPAGNIYAESAIYTDIIENVQGCDSIITIDLTILESVETTQEVVGCGFYISDMGIQYNSTGIYTETYQAANGCDSLVHLDVTIDVSYVFDVSLTACDAYTTEFGDTYTESGVVLIEYMTALGCDSIFIVDLTIVDTEFTIEQVGNTLITESLADSYQWYACDSDTIFTAIEGETTDSFEIMESGQYMLETVLDGCISQTECFPAIFDGIQESSAQTTQIYPNPSNGDIVISSSPGHLVSIYTIDGRLIRSYLSTGTDNLSLHSGVYVVKVSNSAERISLSKIIIN